MVREQPGPVLTVLDKEINELRTDLTIRDKENSELRTALVNITIGAYKGVYDRTSQHLDPKEENDARELITKLSTAALESLTPELSKAKTVDEAAQALKEAVEKK